VPSCHLVQERRQQEDYDKRRYQVPVDVAEVRLVPQCGVGNGGRVREGQGEAHVDVIPRTVQKHCGGDAERDQDGDGG